MVRSSGNARSVLVFLAESVNGTTQSILGLSLWEGLLTIGQSF